MTQNSLPAARQAWGRSRVGTGPAPQVGTGAERAVLAAEAGGEVTAGWARHRSNRDQHVPVTIPADAWHQGGSKLEPPNRWAEPCSEIQTGQGLDYQKGRIWKELERGLLVSFPSTVTV